MRVFYLGCIWVGGAAKDVVYDKHSDPENYCHPKCFRFAYATIMATWCILTVFWVVVLVVSLIVALVGIKSSSRQQTPSASNNQQQ